MEGFKKCPACGNAARILESHHIVPVCYGGRADGLQVSICNTCHRNIHSYEKTDETPPAHLAKYVAVVREARRASLSGMTEALDSRRHVPVTLTPEQERIVDSLSRRFNVRGRAATIKALIDHIAVEWRLGD